MLAHFFFFFFNDTATTEIYTLSLHDALPISPEDGNVAEKRDLPRLVLIEVRRHAADDQTLAFLDQDFGLCLADRKSTRLNSSHGYISYAVFCLKKKRTASESIRTSPTICHSI